jgi:hypothetical protein
MSERSSFSVAPVDDDAFERMKRFLFLFALCIGSLRILEHARTAFMLHHDGDLPRDAD